MLANARHRRWRWPSALRRPTRHPLVVDPVMVATSGDALLAGGRRRRACSGELLPLADSGHAQPAGGGAPARSADRRRRSGDASPRPRRCSALGCRAVLLKGGHGSGDDAVDYLCDGRGVARFALPRIDTRHTHGTGCTLSAAIAALLARGVGLRRGGGARQVLRVAGLAGRTRPRRRARRRPGRPPVRHPPLRPAGVTAGVTGLVLWGQTLQLRDPTRISCVPRV